MRGRLLVSAEIRRASDAHLVVLPRVPAAFLRTLNASLCVSLRLAPAWIPLPLTFTHPPPLRAPALNRHVSHEVGRETADAGITQMTFESNAIYITG